MSGRSVLVVEDDSGIRTLIVDLLVEAGYVVLEATRGTGGLLLAQEFVPSVVIVNHILPDMSGLDLLERLRHGRETRGIPSVLVSGRIQQLAPDGTVADRVLPLPFDIEILLAHVEELAGSRRGAVA
jgi:DNA-binding response OmpR family regulator